MTRILLVLPVLALTGCVTAPEPPVGQTTLDAPARWANDAAAEDAAPTALSSDWWRLFEAPDLDALVARALTNNPDLEANRRAVAAARAQARAAGAGLLPTLDASGSGTRSWPGQRKPGNSFQAGFDAAYEVDLWGGTSAEVEAAEASAAGTAFDRDAAALGLTADVATTWFQILNLNDRLTSARRILAITEETLTLVETQAALGAASGLEVAQQRGAVASLRAEIPRLEQSRAEAGDALAALLGTTVASLPVMDGGLSAVTLPEVTPGLPSELLTRRPDVRSAEAAVTAAGASLRAARAAMFPSLRLTGGGGWSSDELASLFTPGGFLASLAAGLTQPLFDGGRLAAQRDSAEEEGRQAEARYRSAVIAAFQDVEDALAAVRYSAEIEAAQAEAYVQTREAHRLAEARYRAGRTDFLSLLDAQRSLFEQEDSLEQSHLSRLNAAVALVKALGGGWSE